MKKLISITLAVLMLCAAVTLAGCGSAGELIPELEPAAEAPATNPPEAEAPATNPPDEEDLNGLNDALMIAQYAIASPEKAEYPLNPASAELDINSDEYRRLHTEWINAMQERVKAAEGAPDMEAFVQALTNELLSQNEGKNLVFSPANIYIALAMLAEVSGGNTRAELLNALGVNDIESLRSGVVSLIMAESFKDGAAECSLANSIWMNESIAYNTDTLDLLAQIYMAYAFSGDPAGTKMTNVLRAWLNENTGGLLKDSIDGIQLDPSTVLAIASTIYLKNSWANEYNKDFTKEDVFHAITGDITCDFMEKGFTGTYIRGTDFSAVWDDLEDGTGRIAYLLPDEGVSIAEMLESGALERIGVGKKAGEFLADEDSGWTITLRAPKMDVSSDLDLIPALSEMGLNDCFDPMAADFTPLTTDVEAIYVDQVKHAARVKTDEEGIEAAAYTLIWLRAGGFIIPAKEVEITLDRPFMFVVTGETGAPLFIGVVNTPME